MGPISSTLAELGAWNWLIAAGVLVILELLAPGFFLMFFGFAAALVGLIALNTEISWQYQFLLFAGFSVVGVLFARQFWVYQDFTSDRPLLNRRAAQHVGRTYVLEEAIENGRGKIRIGDSLWSVEGPDLPKGAQVTVVAPQVVPQIDELGREGRLTLERGLPAVRLERGFYVYLAGDVLKWLAARKSSRGATVCQAEDGVSTP